MTEPIVLTRFGETLLPHDHTTDSSKLSTNIGVHEVCQGMMHIRQISTTHQAINCRACQLRVVIPHHVTTYGALRQHLVELTS